MFIYLFIFAISIPSVSFDNKGIARNLFSTIVDNRESDIYTLNSYNILWFSYGFKTEESMAPRIDYYLLLFYEMV